MKNASLSGAQVEEYILRARPQVTQCPRQNEPVGRLVGHVVRVEVIQIDVHPFGADPALEKCACEGLSSSNVQAAQWAERLSWRKFEVGCCRVHPFDRRMVVR